MKAEFIWLIKTRKFVSGVIFFYAKSNKIWIIFSFFNSSKNPSCALLTDHILQFAGVNLGSAPSVGAMQLAILILAMLLPPIWVTMQNR